MSQLNIIINKTCQNFGNINNIKYQTLKIGEFKYLDNNMIIRLGSIDEIDIGKNYLENICKYHQTKIFIVEKINHSETAKL